MPSIPLDVDDEVLYTIRKVYLSRDTSVTIQTRLDFWGTVFFNGQPIANIGAIPMATQAQAEAGTDNSVVMSPLRSRQGDEYYLGHLPDLKNIAWPKARIYGNDNQFNFDVNVGGSYKFMVDGASKLQLFDTTMASKVPHYLSRDPVDPTEAATKAYVDSLAGSGVVDGDKGDIVVIGGIWTFDSSIITPAAKTLLDDTTTAAMLATLGADTKYVDVAGDTMTGILVIRNNAGKINYYDADGTTFRGAVGTVGGYMFTNTGAINIPFHLMVNGSAKFSIYNDVVAASVPVSLPGNPATALLATPKQYVDAGDAVFTQTVKGTVPPPVTLNNAFLRDDGLWVVPAGGGAGVTDGDKGDIVVSASGATWMFDSTVVTAAAKTILDDTSIAAIKTTLGLDLVSNTADSSKPVSTAQANADALRVLKAGDTMTGPLTAQSVTADGIVANSYMQLKGNGTILYWTDTTGGTIYSTIQGTTQGWFFDIGGNGVDFQITDTGVISGLNIQAPTVLLTAAPSAANHATRKDYVDSAASNGRYAAITSIAATSYTLALADEPNFLTFTAGTAITLVPPTQAILAIPIGAHFDFVQTGAGKITVANAGVTIQCTPSATLRAQYSAASLIKVASNTWVLTGDLA